MSERFLLGLDVGGGSVRALVLDTKSGELCSASRSWSFTQAPSTGGMGADADLEQVLARLADATSDALGRAGARAEELAGVAVSATRFGLAVVDQAGDVLYAGPNRDARATGEAIALAAAHGAELARRSGHWPGPLLAAPRLQWLRDRQPELFERAATAFSFSDWLAFRLCGEIATDPSQAACTGLFDIARGEWADDWIERLSLPRALFPPVRKSGSLLGALLPEAAKRLGLRPGTPVAVGGADTQCGLLGAGAVAPGEVAMIAGTTAPVEVVLPKPAVDPEARLWASVHVVDGRGVLESNAGPLGEALAWFGRMLYPTSPEPVSALLAEAESSQPGACATLSTLGAQIHDARALELPLGTLTLSHLIAPDSGEAREHLARAAVEGAAYALRANLEQLQAVVPGDPAGVRLGGGLSRSGVFASLLADVLGLPVEVSRSAESTALGAALCAGAGAGLFESVAVGAADFAQPTHRHEPAREASTLYAERYLEWQRLRQSRADGDAMARGFGIRELLTRRAGNDRSEEASFQPRILVTADLDDESLATLRELGSVEYQSFRERMRLLTGDSLVDALQDVHVFITEVDVVDVAAVAQLPDLRVVASCRSDPVNVDIPGMTALGVPVLNAPGRNSDAVADLALAYLIMLARKLPRATGFLREGHIEPGDMGKMGQAFGTLQGRELWRKTVGLIGMGAVGRGVARRLAPFGARVLVHDPFVSPEQASLAGAKRVGLDELLAACDFVSLHAPVTEQTRGLIGAAELARMKPGTFLINTARAALVDEAALDAALTRGHLGGAALDVFSVEPPGSHHPLLAHENVIASPHVGGNTVEVASHQGHIIAGDLARLLRAETPHAVLNPAALADFDWERPRPEPDATVLRALRESPGPAVSDLQRDAKPKPAQEKSPMDASAPPEIIAGMERIMTTFVAGIVDDATIAAKAAGQDVTLHFSLSDLPCQCWFRLRHGEVEGGLGAPDETAEVQLKMKAYVFDGMFTGEVNAMEKSMSGELSFTGDTGKAMTLQQLQRDLARLYRAARASEADLPDLTALGDRSGPATQPVAAVGDVRNDVVAIVDELYATQLITATGGNVSVRVPSEKALWITPSQMFKGDLRPEILVRIDLENGQPLDEDSLSPSSERLMHCAAYGARPDAGAVIHCHAPNATILVNAGLPFLPISTEAAFFDDLPRIPFTMPGTAELADAVAAALETSWAVLMQNHGILVAGRSLRRAADMAEIIERTAEVIIGCYSVGKEPPVLPADVVKRLREMGDLIA